MKKNLSGVITPAQGKPLKFKKEGEPLPLDGLHFDRKIVMPGEKKESRVSEWFRSMMNIIKTGNSAGMPRKCHDEAVKRLLIVLAVGATLTAAGVAISKAPKAIENHNHKHYLRNVPAEQVSDAERYYDKSLRGKLTNYEVGDATRKGRFSGYESEFVGDYDLDNDGRPDIRVRRQVPTDIFFGHVEGDIADETHGSWKRYSHPMAPIASEISDAEGSIEDLHTGRIVDFSKKKSHEGM